MNTIRARFKVVIICVLLLAIILCSVVLYTMETGKTPTAQAGTNARPPATATVANPVTAVNTASKEPVKTTVELTVDGKTVTVSSFDSTTADFLRIAGIKIGDEDILSNSLSTRLSNGASINVIRTLYREKTEVVETPYETEYIDDSDMYEGETEIDQQGVTGITLNVYEVMVHDGKVASKELIASEEETEVQNEIIRRGTMTRDEDSSEYVEESWYDEPEDEPDTVYESDEEEEDTSSYTVTFNGSYQEYAYSLFPQYGWSDADFTALVALWNAESGWNPYACNPWSGAYGIPQALPGDRMAAYGDDWQTNGYTQIRWGLDYIAGRYGSPSVAYYDYFCVRGWY